MKLLKLFTIKLKSETINRDSCLFDIKKYGKREKLTPNQIEDNLRLYNSMKYVDNYYHGKHEFKPFTHGDCQFCKICGTVTPF